MTRKRVRFEFPSVPENTVPTQDRFIERVSDSVQPVSRSLFPVSPREVDRKRRAQEVGKIRENVNGNGRPWYSSSLARKKKSLTLSFTSRRVRVPGSVNNHYVPEITVNTASDVSCVALSFLKNSPHTQKMPSKNSPTSAHVITCS